MGTSKQIAHFEINITDHPHAYGDKLDNPICAPHAPGSSPRVWGQVKGGDEMELSSRIIPTRMGTRISSSLYSAIGKDHPHAYGDKICFKVQIL